MFRSIHDIIKSGQRITKGELAESVYPGMIWDSAIPQSWFDDATERGMDLVVGDSALAMHFVTLYPDHGAPYVAPLTTEGVQVCAILASVK